MRTAAAVAKGGANVARRGGRAARGLFCYFFAILWAVTGLAHSLETGSLPSIIGIGAMVAIMVWVGNRAFAKARATSDKCARPV